MTRTRYRSLAATAAGVLLLAALAGCGGDDKKAADEPGSTGPSSSATATDGSTPSTDPSAGATSGAASGSPVSVAAFVKKLSAAMKDQPSVHMSIAGGGGVQLEADVRYGKSSALRMQTDIGGSQVSVLVVDGTLFLQQPDRKYLEIDQNDPTYGSLLGSFKDFGPRSSVKALQSGISKVVEVGPETVDGEELVRYDVTADTSKSTGAFSQLAGAGEVGKFITMRFFLEPDGLVRQISVDASGKTVSMKFSDWGKPVDIERPKKSQLVAPTS